MFCWVFRVQGFHNNRCKRTDALVVSSGLTVCFALTAPSHGPTKPQICFFLSLLGFDLYFNQISEFPPVSVFYLGCNTAPSEMPGDFGICWNHLSSFCSYLWCSGCLLWLICGWSFVFWSEFSFRKWSKDCFKTLQWNSQTRHWVLEKYVHLIFCFALRSWLKSKYFIGWFILTFQHLTKILLPEGCSHL